jgi:hypothetical protein
MTDEVARHIRRTSSCAGFASHSAQAGHVLKANCAGNERHGRGSRLERKAYATQARSDSCHVCEPPGGPRRDAGKRERSERLGSGRRPNASLGRSSNGRGKAVGILYGLEQLSCCCFACTAAGQQLKQHNANAVDLTTYCVFAAKNLGRHVAGRAQDNVPRESCCTGTAMTRCSVRRPHSLGEPAVEQLGIEGATLLGQSDVGSLDVAVQNGRGGHSVNACCRQRRLRRASRGSAVSPCSLVAQAMQEAKALRRTKRCIDALKSREWHARGRRTVSTAQVICKRALLE